VSPALERVRQLRGVAIDDESLNNALAARKLYAKALQLDPRLVGAMRSLGGTYMTELDLNPHGRSERRATCPALGTA
jgi:hypothetical protein